MLKNVNIFIILKFLSQNDIFRFITIHLNIERLCEKVVNIYVVGTRLIDNQNFQDNIKTIFKLN